jgi:poly(3-hydroxybutyrate) depolymerase
MHRRAMQALAALGLMAGAALAQAAEPLPALKIDPAEVSVSGLSSGGFMAVQMHVAFSSVFTRGAGIVAGGPFYCAEGALFNATGRCMTHDADIPVDTLAATTRTWAQQGFLDPVDTLKTTKVYLFSGTQDPTVKPAVMDGLQAYYRQFLPESRIKYRHNVAAGHAMVTDDFGSACDTTGTPFINDCDVDLAGDILKHLHGPLAARNAGALTGRFIEFDQTAFVHGRGMANTGWVYVPASCTAQASCGVHVVFHGCRQNTATVGEKYVRSTGYNRWADSNHLIVLYPQTSGSAVNGCWDWWGYDSPDYARKTGPQMAAVRAMVAWLSGQAAPAPAPGVCVTATNAAHVSAGRAYYWWGVAHALGSNQSLGWWLLGNTTLLQTGPGRYELAEAGACP